MGSGQLVNIARRAQGAIHELVRAHSYSDECGSDCWEFAVEIGELKRGGLWNSDMRLLVESGHLSHAEEVTTRSSQRREFAQNPALTFSKSTCFVLTESGRDLFQSMFGIEDDGVDVTRPHWDIEKRELLVGKALVKRYRCPALNQETVLGVFQEEGWPRRIDDPLPPLSGQEQKRRLHDTIKSLNKNQIKHLIKFRGDGTGEGVIWEFVDSEIKSDGGHSAPELPHVTCINDANAVYKQSDQEGHSLRKEG